MLGNLEKDDLGNVVGIFGLTQDPERGVVDGTLIADDQVGERGPIALPAALDQCDIGVIVINYTRAPGKLDHLRAG